MSWDWQLFLNFFLSTSFFQNIFNSIPSFYPDFLPCESVLFYIHSFFKFHLARSLSTSLLLSFPLAPLTFHWCCCRKPHDVHVGLPWLSPCWSAAASPRFPVPWFAPNNKLPQPLIITTLPLRYLHHPRLSFDPNSPSSTSLAHDSLCCPFPLQLHRFALKLDWTLSLLLPSLLDTEVIIIIIIIII